MTMQAAATPGPAAAEAAIFSLESSLDMFKLFLFSLFLLSCLSVREEENEEEEEEVEEEEEGEEDGCVNGWRVHQYTHTYLRVQTYE